MSTSHRPSRRAFMRGAVGAAAGLTILGATARGQAKICTAGLVGCGGRGMGAARNFLEAGEFLKINTKITALADAYPDKLAKAAQAFEVPKNRQFTGFTAYKKLIDSDVDVVILATPPVFRPVHFQAAIKAKKHVFMEKPVAVDPPGSLAVIEAGEAAKAAGLRVAAGTQRRHEKKYIGCYNVLRSGEFGQILGGAVYWCGGHLRYRNRDPKWSNREYLIRNWPNFVEMSGDHIIEQHVHNIDVANWYLGTHPSLAVGFGARARRLTGNQFDFFSIDFTYGKQKIHIHSMSRQIDGCWNRVGEHFLTEKGNFTSGRMRFWNRKRVKLPDMEGHDNPYVQELVALLDSIRKGDADQSPINEAQEVAESTLTGIMGRIAAYTGQAVRWGDVADPKRGRFAKLALKPSALDLEKSADVPVPTETPPLPGEPHQ